MRKPTEDVRIFAERRQRIGRDLPGSAVIVAAHPEQIRNHDVGYPYRQDSNMYYLTGFEEPESILIFRPGLKPESVMFVRRRDKERETWDGFRFGPEGVEKEFGIDKAYPIDEFMVHARALLKEVDKVYYALCKNDAADRKFQAFLDRVSSMHGRTGYGLFAILDAD